MRVELEGTAPQPLTQDQLHEVWTGVGPACTKLVVGSTSDERLRSALRRSKRLARTGPEVHAHVVADLEQRQARYADDGLARWSAVMALNGTDHREAAARAESELVGAADACHLIGWTVDRIDVEYKTWSFLGLSVGRRHTRVGPSPGFWHDPPAELA
jgi:hypothetical protein